MARCVGRREPAVEKGQNDMTTSTSQTPGAAPSQALNVFDTQMKAYLAQRLAGFADQLRTDMSEARLHRIEMDAALVLFDLCNYLGLSVDQQHQVLGASMTYVDLLVGNYETIELSF